MKRNHGKTRTSGVFDGPIVRRHDLTSVGPGDFVSVVHFGVVRGGDHDAAARAQLAHGVGNPRRRHHFREQVDADARVKKDGGHTLGEAQRIVPTVVTCAIATGMRGRKGHRQSKRQRASYILRLTEILTTF